MNVLIVKTHKTNGRAWAAWKIKEEKAQDLEYVVSVGRDANNVVVYNVNDFVSGRFFGNDYNRVAFDLEIADATDSTDVLASLRNDGVDLLGSGWVLKFANV